MDKFIIELPDSTAWLQWVKVVEDGTVYFDYKYPEDLTPYTEPNMEQVRKEAYEQGYTDGRKKHEVEIHAIAYTNGKQDGYQKGLNDAWEAARKIYLPEDHGGLGMVVVGSIFNTDNRGWIFKKMPVTEAIEKIRQYEQEQKNKQEENKESCQNCKFAKNPKAQEPCVRCSHSFYNFFRAKVKETGNATN